MRANRARIGQSIGVIATVGPRPVGAEGARMRQVGINTGAISRNSLG